MCLLPAPEDRRIPAVLIVFTRRGECRGSRTARSNSRRGSFALRMADIANCRISSIRSLQQLWLDSLGIGSHGASGRICRALRDQSGTLNRMDNP